MEQTTAGAQTLYVIDQSKPFAGRILSTMTFPNRVDYTGYLYNGNRQDFTFEEYKKHLNNDSLTAVTWEELQPMMESYHLTLQKDFAEVTEEQYYEALECLPPSKWHDLNKRFNSFYICEAQTAHLHSFYIKDRQAGKYYSAIRSRYITDEQLLNQLNNL